MQRVKSYLKKAFTPITIMFIPHSNVRPLTVKIPSIGIAASVLLLCAAIVYFFTLSADSAEYIRARRELSYYSGQFMELKDALSTLKRTSRELERLVSFKSRDQILENLDMTDSGSLDIEGLKSQIKSSMETIGEIKDYLSQQRSVYMATPKGWPATGHVTSPYGERQHPVSGKPEFHSGVDIAADPDSPVRATADGIVSFAGWAGNNGNLVVLEHGLGFSTFYCHNRRIAVHRGQRVRRGDVISYVGSTGNSTGPHVHYEVWREGKSVNPKKYLEGRS
jgi:murein DD-endopeptidase MepM/ murein hydrolase activator NlpD